MMRRTKIILVEGLYDSLDMVIEGRIPEIMIFGDLRDLGGPHALHAYTIENIPWNSEAIEVRYFYSGACPPDKVEQWLWPKHD